MGPPVIAGVGDRTRPSGRNAGDSFFVNAPAVPLGAMPAQDGGTGNTGTCGGECLEKIPMPVKIKA
jgi:hypothetical protein